MIQTPLQAGAQLLRWLPLLAAFAFFSHLCWFGLRPTLAERARLEGVRHELVEQRAELEREAAELDLRERALADPIHQERVRRRIRNEATAPPNRTP